MSDGTQTLPAKWRPVTEESRPQDIRARPATPFVRAFIDA